VAGGFLLKQGEKGAENGGRLGHVPKEEGVRLACCTGLEGGGHALLQMVEGGPSAARAEAKQGMGGSGTEEEESVWAMPGGWLLGLSR
jgi:hypothetical protein